jgi:purine-nucleoside phosphorylase
VTIMQPAPPLTIEVGRPTSPRGVPRQGAHDAAERVVAAGGCPATIGVVLGTGLGGLADRLTSRFVMKSADTRWLAKSSATGHARRIVCGTLRGVPIAMLQGRVHGYEGFPAETLTRGVELLAALGVSQVLLTNASGGLRPDMVSGELVIVTDHIDLVRQPWGAALEPDDGEPIRRTTWYDPALVDLAMAATRRVDAVARKGVYAFLSGPSYETRAEYRMLRTLGADVVGMSTVPEVVAAARMGIDVVVCSVVTNVARPDAIQQIDTDAEHVCQMAAGAAEGVWAILEAIASRAARRPCVSC